MWRIVKSEQYIFSLPENFTLSCRLMPTPWNCGDFENWHVSIACFVVWSQGHDGVSVSLVLLLCYMCYKQIQVQLFDFQNFIWYFASMIFHFSGQIFWIPIATRLLSSIRVAEDRVKQTSANAHSVSCLMYIDSMVLQNDVSQLSSQTASDGRP